MPRRRKHPDQASDSLSTETPDADAKRYGRPSKSVLKREMHELQRLGAELLLLRPDQLAAMPLDERLRDAVELGRRITAHEAIRRQKQLIGKLMRQADAASIREALDRIGTTDQADAALARAAEQWRSRLLDEPDAVAQFVQRYNALEIARRIPKMIELARAERSGTGQAGPYRSLFRTLLKAMRADLSRTES